VKVTGTWLGQYTYGPGYGSIAGMSVPFTMSLTESWLRKVSGYVRDDARHGGMPERGRILGDRSKAQLEFTKTMPKSYQMDGNKHLVDLREVVQRDHGVELPAELPPHRIRYTGALAEDGMSIAGQWQILPWSVSTGTGQVGGAGGRGTWTAKRVADQPSEV